MWEHILERVLKMATDQFDEAFVEVQACMWDPRIKGENRVHHSKRKESNGLQEKGRTEKKDTGFLDRVGDKDLVIDAKYYDNLNAAFLPQ